jgi:hypothetical protein
MAVRHQAIVGRDLALMLMFSLVVFQRGDMAAYRVRERL